MSPEKLEEHANDIAIENNIRNDIDFALDHLNAQDIVERLEDLSTTMSSFGHEISVKEILERIL